jgi:replication factor C subunit 1
VPIICIVNDRQHQKIKSLANHCYDLEFKKPLPGEIIKRVSLILKKEGRFLDEALLREIIEMFNNDLRQVLNYLQYYNYEVANSSSQQNKIHKKDKKVQMTNFSAAQFLMDRKSFDNLSIRERNEIFFVDFEWIPLIV